MSALCLASACFRSFGPASAERGPLSPAIGSTAVMSMTLSPVTVIVTVTAPYGVPTVSPSILRVPPAAGGGAAGGGGCGGGGGGAGCAPAGGALAGGGLADPGAGSCWATPV